MPISQRDADLAVVLQLPGRLADHDDGRDPAGSGRADDPRGGSAFLLGRRPWQKPDALSRRTPGRHQAREQAGREASPSGGVIDSQSVKTTESGGPRGDDAGKKVNGRKRHIITDTNGLLVGAQVHGADIQDRDGAVGVLASIRYLFPWLRHIFADGGYAGEKLERTFAWLGRNRRLAKDFEATIGSAEAWLYLAAVQLLARRLARSGYH